MVKHVVFFRFKDNSPESIGQIKDMLLSMKGNVSMIQNMEVGLDFLHSERSYDICLQVEVADRGHLVAYDKDSYHCDVVKKYMFDKIISVVAVDYEF